MGSTLRRPRPRAIPLDWGCLLGFMAAYCAWLLARPVSEDVALAGVAVGAVLGPMLGFLLCVPVRLAWTDAGPRPRLVRGPALAACACFAVGVCAETFAQATWYVYYYAFEVEVPMPSWADAGYLAAYAFSITGLLLLPVRRPSVFRSRVLLDSLLTILAVGTISWHLVLGPVISDGEGGAWATAFGAAYPVLDLLQLFYLLLMAPYLGAPSHRSAVWPLSAGLCASALVDSVFAHQVFQGTYHNGDLIDAGWPLSYLLIGIGARRFMAIPEATPATDPVTDQPGDGNSSLWRSLAPYALLPLVALLLLDTYAYPHEPLVGAGTYAGSAALVVLVLVRQVVALRERARLYARLRAMYDELGAGHRRLAEAHDRLRQSEERFRIAADSAGDIMYELDLRSNDLRWFGDIDAALGYAPGGFGRDLATWARAIHPGDRPAAVAALRAHLDDGTPFGVEYRVATRDGGWRYWTDRGATLRAANGTPIRMVGAVTDVTERRLAEERLRYESLHDPLTGLPNRAHFTERLQQRVARARADGDWCFAVLFLDLDRFKVVNDSLGHAAGDRLLVTIAERLRACVRGGGAATDRADDVVARLGGDEFTVLVQDLSDPHGALALAGRLRDALREPVDYSGHDLTPTVSVGIVHGDARYAGAKDMLRDADAAMYRAKTRGKDRCAVFDASMHEEAMSRLRVESSLRRAIARGEMRLHYQPIVSLETRDLAGFEALVRWERCGRIISPADFIPIAEDTGLIVPMGNWVIEEACRQLVEWSTAPGGAGLSVSVNISRRQLTDPGLVDHVGRVLADTGLAPHRLKLEITESSIMEEGQAADVVLRQLKALGIRLHMDDFGTGYSSLSCLHQFPIDGLKIDRAFIRNISERRDYAAVIQAILQLAHNLGADVVAEGVETADQVAMLQALSCGYGQGYYFSKPVPPDAAARLLDGPLRLARSA